MEQKLYFNTRPELGKTLNFIKTEIVLLKIFIFLLIFLIIFFVVKIFSYYFKISKIKKKYKILINELKEYNKRKLKGLEGKEFIKAFINFIENMKIEGTYKDIKELLKIIGIKEKDIKKAENIIYKDSGEIEKIERKLKEILDKI